MNRWSKLEVFRIVSRSVRGEFVANAVINAPSSLRRHISLRTPRETMLGIENHFNLHTNFLCRYLPFQNYGHTPSSRSVGLPCHKLQYCQRELLSTGVGCS